METKHTTGPWSLKRIGDEEYIASNYGLIASVVCDEGTNNDQDANADMIAAAPELLGALVEIVSQIDQGGSGGKVFARDCCIDRARAAIKKAIRS